MSNVDNKLAQGFELKPAVRLLNYTGYGSPDPARLAAELLVFTKSTRLEMKPDLMGAIESMSDKEMEVQLKYIANTIPSSWEYVDYTFLLTNVTRAFTHQFVRTRNGSYAQQTMRVLNVGGWTYATGPSIKDNPERHRYYRLAMDSIAEDYDALIAMGANIEDARGVLPTNIHTNIVAKFNLRTICEMARKRASGRVQGEYRTVMEMMKIAVMAVHPWTAHFLERDFDKSAADLEAEIMEMPVSKEQRTHMIKLLDQMRTSS